jgi:DNA primase
MNLDINIENMNDYGRSSGLYNEQKRIEKALAMAATYYSHRIASDVTAGTARKHLMARRIRPDTAFKFQIGYAPHPSFSTSSSNSPYKNKNGENEVEKERSVPRSITANLTGKNVYSTLQCVMCGKFI